MLYDHLFSEQAKPKTLSKVCDIVKSQLALSDDKPLTPEPKFSDLGADSLDTVMLIIPKTFKLTSHYGFGLTSYPVLSGRDSNGS